MIASVPHRRLTLAVVAALVGALGSGCATLHTDTRVERGPVLRTFEREAVTPQAGLQAQVAVRWPALDVSVSRYSLCRKERVEEALEEKITEVSSPSAGPAIGTGLTNLLLGGGLYLASGLFSSAPNTRTIDQQGRYGPSDQQLGRGWGLGLMIFGTPALVTGLVELAQTGETSETRKVEQVVNSAESACQARAAEGNLLFSGPDSASPGVRAPLAQGKATVTAEQLRAGGAAELVNLTLDGDDLLLEDEDRARLEAFRACGHVLPPAVVATDVVQLHEQLDAARACASVAREAAGAVIPALEKALQEREQVEGKSVPRLSGFEEALAAYAPKQRYNAGSEDLAQLPQQKDQAVVVEGILSQRLAPNIWTMDVGATRLLLFVEPDRPWAVDLVPGLRVEVLGVVAGKQTLGETTAPLLRAVWIRTLM